MRNDTKIETLHDRMRLLKGKDDSKSKAELEDVIKEIADNAETNFKKLKKELECINADSGRLDANKLWKLRKKMCPKLRDPPTAMMDRHGNVLASEKAISERAVEVYEERLANNKIKPHLTDLEQDTNKLCEIRLEISKKNTTDPWNMEDLKIALKQLHKNRSADPDGYINELFKEAVAGHDLLLAILKLMNKIKTTQEYPKNFQKCNITSLYKKKSRKDFNNYRGVFRVQTFRSILDRMTYNDAYYSIDNNISDGSVGARKQRGVRDNIFVISAISNSVLNGNSQPIQVQIMDAEKCFDKLWLQSCINAIYEAGMDTDQLNLLYIENKNAQIAVKVNNKLSMRINVKDVIMQGSVWSSLKCTTSMDRLNKIALQDESLQYCYKGDKNIPIGVLGFVDDTLGVSECGKAAIKKNSVINSFMDCQRLTLSKEKSVVLRIGKHNKCVLPWPKLKVHNDTMEATKCTKYLRNMLSSKGGVPETKEDRRKKGWGKIAQIFLFC